MKVSTTTPLNRQLRTGLCVLLAAGLTAAACSGAEAPDAMPAGDATTSTSTSASPAVGPAASTPTTVPADSTGPSETGAPTEATGSDSPATTGAPAAPSPVVSQEGQANAGFTPILVDQFGYSTTASKVAVLVDPVQGLNAEVDYQPGDELQVVNVDRDSVVFTGPPVQWRSGAEDPQNGDRGWHFDFSALSEPGTYRIVDTEAGVTSGPFVISDSVYDGVLTTAQRVFYYNRGNVPHVEPYAAGWTSDAVAVRSGQDTEAASIDDPNLPRRDLSGGWFDAGDTNKYVTFATSPVHQLLGAYRTSPGLFGDNTNIPESGNGVSDLLDEVRIELEWLTRMQLEDGGVLTKVGYSGYGGEPPLPSDDARPRYYEEACSSSSIATAGMFAHGAIVFASSDPGFAADLTERAQRAWAWFESNPRRDDCDPQVINAGDADVSLADQDGLRFVAAVFLAGATDDPVYTEAIRAELNPSSLFPGDAIGRYKPERAEAVEFYLLQPDGDPNLQSMMRSMVAGFAGNRNFHGFDENASLYRSFMPDAQYHWGSNMVMANTGNGSLALARLGIDEDANIERARAHLHTLNGVNPLGIVYLSNMNALGAERSITQIYHFWFGEGSQWDDEPAPGYVVGGPNASYSGSVDVERWPVAKAYADFNQKDNEARPWELSEPAIYYQAAYIRLLAGVMAVDR